MIDPIAAHQLGAEATFLLASGDPLRAVAILARAIRPQPRGGRCAVVRTLVKAVAGDDPRIMKEIANDMAKLAIEQGG